MSLGYAPSYAFAVFDRATNQPVDLGPRTRLLVLAWHRRRGAESTADVTLAPGTMPDLRRVAAHPRRHNLIIWRDVTVDPVWSGPIYSATESDTGVVIQAQDILSWLRFRTLDVLTETFTGDVAALTRMLLGLGLGDPADPIPYQLRVDPTGTTKTVASWTGLRPYVASEVRRLCADTINLTAAGERIFGWSITDTTRQPAARVSPDQMGGSMSVASSAADMASLVRARSQGLEAVWPPSGTPAGEDGLIEAVVDARGTGDEADLTAAAKDGWLQRHQPAISMGLDGSIALPPTFPLSIEQLIGGARIAAVAPPGRNLQAAGVFELDRLDVTIGSTGDLPRDTKTGRFTASAQGSTETVTASWAPVPGLVSLL